MSTKPTPASSFAYQEHSLAAQYANSAELLAADDLSGESALWRAVLGQAIRDLYSGQERARTETLRWMASRDFDTVCDYAYVEPGPMREQMLALSQLATNLARKYGTILRREVMASLMNRDD